jgi:hypothetical protein
MNLARSLTLALTLAAAGPLTWAAQDDQHQTHHPAGTASAPASKAMPGQPDPDMGRIDAQMKDMGAMHDKMMAATTPEERNALMAEHMKSMQGGMAMMNGMASGSARGKGNMASQHQMMEKRMDMMQSMMQMMMDRMPLAPAK